MNNLEQMFESRRKGLCPFCNKIVDINDFYDLKSLNEYAISGLCVYCQDTIFEKDQKKSFWIRKFFHSVVSTTTTIKPID